MAAARGLGAADFASTLSITGQTIVARRSCVADLFIVLTRSTTEFLPALRFRCSSWTRWIAP